MGQPSTTLNQEAAARMLKADLVRARPPPSAARGYIVADDRNDGCARPTTRR